MGARQVRASARRPPACSQVGGPKAPHSTTLSEPEEVMVVAFRRHTLLPLYDCLYALQPSIPHLTRSALHRCLQRHGISRLPDIEVDKPKRQRFKRSPIGFFHMDIAEVQTAEGKLYLFVAIDRTSKFARSSARGSGPRAPGRGAPDRAACAPNRARVGRSRRR
jgi:hypothetical protein